jgi:alginate O-acetyltransferase complex protein AlgI
MALGLGKIFGFDLPENFNYPYISRSISEFWRRWHITLSAWFRDYLYISLGGNRRGRARMYLNLFIVWSLTGLWHGAGLNFLAWGMYFFLILALEKAFLLKILQKAPAPLCRAYAFLLILIGWLIFASDGAAGSLTALEAVSAIKIMFGAGSSLVSRATLYELSRNAIPLIIMFLASLPLGKRISERLLAGRRASWAYPAISALSLSGIFLSVAYLVNSGYNPFLYFKF